MSQFVLLRRKRVKAIHERRSAGSSVTKKRITACRDHPRIGRMDGPKDRDLAGSCASFQYVGLTGLCQ
jgi:hypothetical protein